MSHSSSSRESSGSPSRKRSRSPASEHSPDSPSLKRRSPSPRQDSAGASPSDRPALPPRLISRRVTRSRSPRHTPSSTRRHQRTPLPSLSPDNALGLNTPHRGLGASAQARPQSPPSHGFTYTADPEHDVLRYPNDEPQADAPEDDHNAFVEVSAIYSEEPTLYTQHQDPYYPPAPRSPSSNSDRFAYRNPSAAPRDVPPAPPAPRSPRSALDAYTFGEPSRALVIEDPVSPRTIPGLRRVEASVPRHGVVPSSAQRGIVPSNAPYTPFYPSPSSQRLRDQVPHWSALAAHPAPLQREAPAQAYQRRYDPRYDDAREPEHAEQPQASTSYAHALTSSAPHPGPSYREPSHYTPQSTSRYEPPQASRSDAPASTSYAPASTSYAPASTSYAPASTSRVPALGPAQWLPPPPCSPRPEHPIYHPQRPAEGYILPPLRCPSPHREPVPSTSRHPIASTYQQSAPPAYANEPSTIGEYIPSDVVAFLTEFLGPDRGTLAWWVADQSWRRRAEAGAGGSELQMMREEPESTRGELESTRRRQAEAEHSRRVWLEEETEALRERVRELEDRDRGWEHQVEELTAILATSQQGCQEREQDLLRANRSMARQLHANGLVPEIEQVDESASEDEVVTPGGPGSLGEDVTVVDASGPVVEPNTVVGDFTQVEELTPEEAVDFEDDLDYVDDFVDVDDEFEVTTPVQANTTVQVATQVETTTPVQRSPAPASSHSTPNLPLAPHPSPAEGPAPRTSESPVPAPSRSAHASASPRTSPKPASQRTSPRLASPYARPASASPRTSPRHASPRTSPRPASPYARPASASPYARPASASSQRSPSAFSQRSPSAFSQRSPSPAESSSSRIRPRPFASSMFSVAPHAMRRRLGAHVFRADAAGGREEEQDEDELEQDEDELEQDVDEPAIKVEPEDDQLVVKLEPEEETLPSSRRSSVAPSSRAT
ncbi:hypothetical protein FB107DRAFT_245998 [Schizophyllum commune]